MKINITFPKPFKPLIDPNVRKVVEPSGRSSGKTTTNETYMITKMLQSPRNNCWYCRAEKNDIRSSIFSSFIGTATMMGVDQYFKTSLNPAEIVCTRTGARCYFGAVNGKTIDDLNATKGFSPWNKHIAVYCLDEANEVKSPDHIRAAEATAAKFLNDDGKIIYSYNPPPVRTHWAHGYFQTEIDNGATRIKTTYNDIRELLPNVLLEQIEKMRVENPKYYAYQYLGQMVSLEGLVMYTFKRERNVIALDKFRDSVRYGGYVPLYIIYGVDSGVVKDPTAVCAWAVMSDATLVKLSTFYLDPRKIGEPVPNSEQVTEILRWYNTFQAQMRAYGIPMPGAYNECWVFDSAVVTQDLMIELRNKTGFYCIAVENKNIERDIKRLQNGYFRGMFKILDIPENEPSFNEIDSFCYDADNKIPDGQNDHTIDADKYATAHYYYGYMNIAG